MAIVRIAAVVMLAACAALAAPKETKVATSAKRLELGAGEVSVTLRPTGTPADGSRRTFLVLRGLSAQNPPGVLYHVYIARHHVGTLNFYDTPPLLSFEVTDALRGARAKEVTVTFTPSGTPDPEAKAAIAKIELVQQ